MIETNRHGKNKNKICSIAELHPFASHKFILMTFKNCDWLHVYHRHSCLQSNTKSWLLTLTRKMKDSRNNNSRLQNYAVTICEILRPIAIAQIMKKWNTKIQKKNMPIMLRQLIWFLFFSTTKKYSWSFWYGWCFMLFNMKTEEIIRNHTKFEIRSDWKTFTCCLHCSD